LHLAVREALASGAVSVPRGLTGEVQRYLECGQLRCGFVEVRCDESKTVQVVAFSCKGRGLCPSCTTRRSVETAAHLTAWLPTVDYRQWTLSLPVRVPRDLDHRFDGKPIGQSTGSRSPVPWEVDHPEGARLSG
jgi:hypothetical protein